MRRGAAIVPHLEDLTRGFRLRVDYDQPYLDQLFAQVESVMGPLVRRIVNRAGAPIGWYAYLCRPGGVSRVLHICAPAAEMEAVLGELVDDARRRGSAVLAGRSEPHLSDPLGRRRPVWGPARCPLVHAGDPEIRALLATSSSLLTQLDGEWFVS